MCELYSFILSPIISISISFVPTTRCLFVSSYELIIIIIISNLCNHVKLPMFENTSYFEQVQSENLTKYEKMRCSSS